MIIQDSRVLLTGASEGLGAALARALAAGGARLVLVARRRGPLEAIARDIRARGGVAHALAADVGDKHAIHRLAGTAHELLGRVDVLVNNASTLGHVPLRLLMDTDCEALEQALAVNVVGPFRLTKAVLGAGLLRGGALVVNVTSDASTQAYPHWGAYGASKAALDQLGRIWAAETQKLGARFLTVDPGEMDTRMHAEAMPDADRAALPSPADAATRLAQLIENCEQVPSGTRLELTGWRRS